MSLDPKSPLANNTAGNAFLYAGKYDDAIPYFNAALEINPDATNARGNLGLCYVNKGIFDTGISEIKKSISSKGSAPGAKNDLAYAYVKAGRMKEARESYRNCLTCGRKLKNLVPQPLSLGYTRIWVKSIRLLTGRRKAYEEHSGYLISINSDFTFDNLRSEPRFKVLLKKIGFPDAD